MTSFIGWGGVPTIIVGASLGFTSCGDAADTSSKEQNVRPGNASPNASPEPEPGTANEAEPEDVPEPDPPSGDDVGSEVNPAARAIAGVVLLEDAEDGDATLLADEEAVFIGYWYAFDDRQECVHPDFADGNVAPCGSEACAASGAGSPTDPPIRAYGSDFVTRAYADYDVAPPPLESMQKENERGIRLSGGGNTYWGAGVGVALNNPGTMQPYDLQAAGFTGLRFLAKSGVPGSALKLRVKLKDAYSEPIAGNCIGRSDVCTASGCECCDTGGTTCDNNLPQGCHDDPMAPADATTVNDEWRLYEIPLNSFVREGWGMHSPGNEPSSSALDATVAYQLQFIVQTDATPSITPLEPFELWLDNIGFVQGQAPDGER